MAQSDDEFAFPEPPEGLVRPQDDTVVAFLDGPDEVEAAMEELARKGSIGSGSGCSVDPRVRSGSTSRAVTMVCGAASTV